MKRITAVILAALLAAVMCCAAAEETQNFTSGDYQYIVQEDGTACITDYTGSAETLDIPDTMDGYAVTAIGDAAFWGASSLMSVTIPDSVTGIGANPFRDCENLSTVKVAADHAALAIVDGVLFSKADRRLVWYPMTVAASSYSISQDIQTVGDYAFFKCSSLTDITIPEGVTVIGEYAFAGCSGLTGITIPDGVTDIGESAFSFCGSVTSITIPDSVTGIGDGVFWGCSSLTSIAIPDGVTGIGILAFEQCSSLTSVTIPASVTDIGFMAFDGCSSNLTLTVPRGSYAAQYAGDNSLSYTYSD